MMKLAMKKRQKGVTMIEYGLIAALISIIAITALTSIGTNVNLKFEEVVKALAPASSGS